MLFIKWIVLLQCAGLAAYPICFGLFPRLPDRGYALAKFLGLLLPAYTCWLLSSLVPLRSWLEFSTTSTRLDLLFWLVVGTGFFVANYDLIRRQSRQIGTRILMIELVFWGGFAAMFCLRATIPQITFIINDSAAEKFMDFAIFNGILCSPSMPPQDAWVSGMPLNYYYFGHFLWAFVTKATDILPEVAFNLSLCSIAGLLCALAFSLGLLAKNKIAFGLFAAFLIVIGGNLDSCWLCLKWLTQQTDLMFDFWRPSRAINNCITEFPAFSLILGDLHAHMIDMPVVLSVLLAVIAMTRTRTLYASFASFLKDNIAELLIIVLCLGAASATNSWDFPILLAFLILMFWIAEMRCVTDSLTPFGYSKPFSTFIAHTNLLVFFLFVGIVLGLIGAGFLFAPFHLSFRAPFSGWPIEFNLPANRTEITEFIAHWGIFLLPFAVLFIGMMCRPGVLNEKTKLLFCSCALLLFVGGYVGGGGLTAAISFTLAGLALFALLFYSHDDEVSLIIAILLLFGVMSFFCELFHLNDIFSGETERINTIFKIYYPLWPILALAALTALARLPRRPRIALACCMIVLAAWYTPVGVYARLCMTSRPPASDTGTLLDGLSYLQKVAPDDLQVIRFVRENVPPTDSILEATGTQYTYASRIATNTGRPTLGGWLYHSWAWRGDTFAPEIDRRTSEARTIYTTHDPGEAAKLLADNEIRWVIIGQTEKKAYPDLDKEKFNKLGKEVFHSDDDTCVFLVFPNKTYQQEQTD